MSSRIISIISAVLALILSANMAEAKKIKQSLKVNKEKTILGATESEKRNDGIRVNACDSATWTKHEGKEVVFSPSTIKFAGYEKEVNSGKETFLIINDSDVAITEIEVEIVYLDMKDRMLHSRTIALKCDVPSGETRKKDIASWDLQHTYYYYLGNEPKKVATPYKVKFQPKSFIIAPSTLP